MASWQKLEKAWRPFQVLLPLPAPSGRAQFRGSVFLSRELFPRSIPYLICNTYTELKSLYFEKSTEIQAFLLPILNSSNRDFEAPCAQKTGVMHMKCTRLKGSITIRKEASSREGAVVLKENKIHIFYIPSS